jgi:hypothetical protein
VQQELKIVTAKVDVAMSKALLASDAEKFLLGEIDLERRWSVSFFELLICSSSG